MKNLSLPSKGLIGKLLKILSEILKLVLLILEILKKIRDF